MRCSTSRARARARVGARRARRCCLVMQRSFGGRMHARAPGDGAGPAPARGLQALMGPPAWAHVAETCTRADRWSIRQQAALEEDNACFRPAGGGGGDSRVPRRERPFADPDLEECRCPLVRGIWAPARTSTARRLRGSSDWASWIRGRLECRDQELRQLVGARHVVIVGCLVAGIPRDIGGRASTSIPKAISGGPVVTVSIDIAKLWHFCW